MKISGLRWVISGADRVAIWRASKPAVRAGFQIKSRPLWRGAQPTTSDLDRIADRCLSLTNEQRDWLRGKRDGRPKPKAALKGIVYFVRAGMNVKIGFTTNLRQRLLHLQTAATEDLELIGTIPCTADREQLLHSNFARYRLRGEWFRIEGDLIAFLHSRFGWRIAGAEGASGSCNSLENRDNFCDRTKVLLTSSN